MNTQENFTVVEKEDLDFLLGRLFKDDHTRYDTLLDSKEKLNTIKMNCNCTCACDCAGDCACDCACCLFF